MSEDLHNIDDLFKKRLEDHLEIPPPSVWENIDKSLDKKKVISISKKYNTLKWAAAVLLLLSVGLAMYTLHVSKRNKELVKQNTGKGLLQPERSHDNKAANDSEFAATDKGLGKLKSSKPGNTEQQLSSSTNKNERKTTSTDEKVRVPGTQSDLSTPTKRANQSAANTIVDNNGSVGNNNRRGDQSISKQAQKKPSLLVQNGSSSNPVETNKNEKETVAARQENTTAKPGNAEKSVRDEKQNMLNAERDRIKEPSNAQQNGEAVAHDILLARQKSIEQISLLPALPDATEITYAKPDLKISSSIIRNSIAEKSRARNKGMQVNLRKSRLLPLSLTLSFSPNAVLTNIKNEEVHYREEDRREIEKEEKRNVSTTFAALVDYRISPKIQLETGITLSSWANHLEPKKIYARPDERGNVNYRFNCSAGYSYLDVNPSTAPASGDSVDALNSNNKLQYIGVPFLVKYAAGSRRFNVVPGLGFSANFLTKGQIKTSVTTSNGNVKNVSASIEGLRPMYLSGVANVAFDYSVSRNFSLSLIPRTEFSLSSINKNAPIKTNLYYFGIAGAVIIKL